METPQSVQPVSDNNDPLKKDAETAYRQFVEQIMRHKGGLQSESEHGKIFSFETYLREKNVAATLIQAYCTHIKTSDFVEKYAAESNKPAKFFRGNFRILLLFFLISWAPGLLLYLPVAAFLSTFGISIWSVKPLLFFALTGPVLVAVLLTIHYIRGKREIKAGTEPQYVIKYFDNDELTFVKSKSRLFVEK
jgi:hypothetical protein